MQKALISALAILVLSPAVFLAQDRLKTMPGYEQHQKMQREMPTAIKSGAINATWSSDSGSFEYTKDGRRYRFDLATRQTAEAGEASDAAAGRGGRGGRCGQGAPERGRQVASTTSPDGTLKAFYRDRNLWLS